MIMMYQIVVVVFFLFLLLLLLKSFVYFKALSICWRKFRLFSAVIICRNIITKEIASGSHTEL